MILLRCCAAAAAHGAVTAAGGALVPTQSAGSLKSHRLEDRLQRRMFVRTGRGLALTHDGEMLPSYARRLLALNGEAVRRLMAPAAGRLGLGVADPFVPQPRASFLARFAPAFPEVHLEVAVGRRRDLRATRERGVLDPVSGKRREGETAGAPISTERLSCPPARGGFRPAAAARQAAVRLRGPGPRARRPGPRRDRARDRLCLGEAGRASPPSRRATA